MTFPTVPLGDLVKIVSGFAFKSELFNDEGCGLPLVRIRDVIRGFSETFYDGPFQDQFRVSNGDLLIGMDGEFNVAKWSGGPALLNQRVCRIQVCDPALNPDYLFWFLPTALKKIEDRTAFVTVKHLSAKDIRAIGIPLPSVLEQRRIATIFDHADGLRKSRSKSLAGLESLRRANFFKLFGDPSSNALGWPMARAGDAILSVTNGLTRRAAEDDGGRDIVLRLRDIRAGRLDLSEPNRITLSSNEASRFKAEIRDLLFVRVNGNPNYVGRCAVFMGSREPIYFNDHIMRVRLDERVLNVAFLQEILNSDYGRRQIARHKKTSAGQHTINQEGLSQIAVPLPPIKIQQEFEAAFDRLNSLRELMIRQQSKLDELLSSLQQRAFNGELTRLVDRVAELA